nr:hypothetical protein [Tanacetum cinerariifolium]
MEGEGSTVLVDSLFPTHTHVADEAASTGVDVRHGGASTIVTSLDAEQGSGNIDKTLSMPRDSPLIRVNILGSDEGRMQHNELMDFVTKLSYQSSSFGGRLNANKEDTARRNVQTYMRRREVSTGSGGVSTASRMISTAEE